MKGLYKVIGVGLVSASLLLGGCEGRKDPTQYTNLQGTVFSERYMPASRGWGMTPSRYSFSMETENGRKAVQVSSTRKIGKESIDALIEPGTKVEVEGIEKSDLDKQVYTVPADKIRVLDKE